MVKKIISIILSAVLVFIAGITALGHETYRVNDHAGILESYEVMELNEKTREITVNYQCDVYIVTVDSLDGMEAWEYNEKYFHENEIGYGNDRSAIVLLLAMEERQYDILAHGFGNIAFTDYGKDVMAERFLDDFANDDWYWGFTDYLDTCDEFLNMAVNGEPLDVGSENISGSEGDSFGANLLGVFVATVVSCVIALLICLVLRSQMKTARIATEAHDYAKQLNLTNQYDIFSHRDVRRVYNPPQENNGGGTTINSGGFSHKSGGF